jgi:hypothetical protein
MKALAEHATQTPPDGLATQTPPGGPDPAGTPGDLPALSSQPGVRIELDEGEAGKGLAKLVLALMRLLHELLERQAARRVEAGMLDDEQVERLGLALLSQTEQIEELCRHFGLSEDELNLDLGPLGKLL